MHVQTFTDSAGSDVTSLAVAAVVYWHQYRVTWRGSDDVIIMASLNSPHHARDLFVG